MTKTDIAIYRGLKEKFDPEVHVGFFITTDTGELLLRDQSLGQTISGGEINDGVLILKLNTGKDIRITFPEATETVKGLLSAADKAQLLALQTNLDSKVDKVTGKSLVEDALITKLTGLPTSETLTQQLSDAKAAGDNAQSDLNAHKNNKSNPHEVTKAQVGLENVTNDAQVKRSEMGVASGVATLDATGKIPISQIPSDFDDVIDVYATYTKSDTGSLSNITLYLDAAKTQLVTGEAGKLYQNVEQGQPSYQFKWAGTEFVQSGASSLIIGEVAGTAYDGAKGKANADNIAKIKGTPLSHIKDSAPVTTEADKVSLNYECFEGDLYGAAGTDHTADIPAATTSTAGVMSAADKTKLDNVATGAEVNVQSDWNETDEANDAFIKNKPTSMPASDVSEWAKAETKPTYTKTEVGLGNVDNTSDNNKPVSTAQAAAIAEAKKAGTDAQAAVEAETSARATAITEAVNALDATVTSTDGTNVQVKVTEVDGKITGVNITKDETAKAADLTAEAARATNAEDVILTALNNHKADKDKKHIPAGGHERQILAWDSDGTAKWDDLANMFTGLEELLAYGVEWKDDVADPHLTRIGNMSLHKTLPIQSQLKGCIAQKDKVIYWLAEDDWRFKKEAETITVNLSEDTKTFTVASVTGLGIGLYLRNGKDIAKITAIDADTNKITVEWELPESKEDEEEILTTITSLEIGSRLDGYDGTVRVYCPSFYIKSKIIGNKRQVWLSTVKIDNTWTYQHEILIDAYRSTVLNTVPTGMGYLSELPAGSAISVVNTADYCRGGGDRADFDKYATGADGTTIDVFRSDLCKPRTNQPRSTFRTECKNAGSEMLSYDQYKNIFYWLYVVEYANFNCLEAYNAELTDDGYHQGGLGNGVTNVSNWQPFNDFYPITPCGYGNDLGNGTGVKPITSPGLTPANGVYMCRWRGFDNPFGDIWTNLDGIIIDADADTHPNNMNYVYTCQDPTKYADNLNEDDYEKVGEEIHQEGYTKLFDLGDAAHIIPNVIGGNTTQYKCDYHWAVDKNTTLRTLVVGGCASTGVYAGLGAFDSHNAVSHSWHDVSFRSVSRFLSFSSLE